MEEYEKDTLTMKPSSKVEPIVAALYVELLNGSPLYNHRGLSQAPAAMVRAN